MYHWKYTICNYTLFHKNELEKVVERLRYHIAKNRDKKLLLYVCGAFDPVKGEQKFENFGDATNANIEELVRVLTPLEFKEKENWNWLGHIEYHLRCTEKV